MHVCLLGTGPHNCEVDWVGGVHVCPLGTGPNNSQAAGWAGCMCVLWGLEQKTLWLLGGQDACVYSVRLIGWVGCKCVPWDLDGPAN